MTHLSTVRLDLRILLQVLSGSEFFLRFHTAGLLLVLLGGWLSAADPRLDDDRKNLVRTVELALQAEGEGDFLARQRLLIEALPSAHAKWRLGELHEDGDWLDVESCIQRASQSPILDKYEKLRSSLADTMSDHFAMASWCAQQELYEQCRSHLNRVLVFDPDNARARRALGYQWIGGEWISPAEIAEIQVKTSSWVSSIREFGDRIRAIRTSMEDRHPKRQEQAVQTLAAIRDPQAVPCVEAVFASADSSLIDMVLSWLGGIDSIEASQSIARFSLFHPQQAVRKRACELLAHRPLHDFVPELLKMLESPVAMMIVPSFDRSGALTGYRQAFARDEKDRSQFLVLDRGFDRNRLARLPTPGGTNPSAGEEAIVLDQLQERSLRQFAAGEARSRAMAVQRENLATLHRNAQIAEVLSQLSGREFTNSPQPMWDWWDEYCETQYQSSKPQHYRRTFLTSRVPRLSEAGSSSTSISCECFVAGTLVITRRGKKPIEQVVVGDTVLSRNIWTGELAWKPVLRSTRRPAERTLCVRTEEEQFQCTSGHLFWVSGSGWRKASELKAGDILHAADEPAVVLEVRPDQTAETFNLEVADNATYFVGDRMVLTHDVTPRRASRQRVPGQAWLTALVGQNHGSHVAGEER